MPSIYLTHLFAMPRHHVFVKIPRQVELAEVGPRFEMKRTLPFLSLLFPSSLTNNKSVRDPTRDHRTNRSRPRMGSGALCADIGEEESIVRGWDELWETESCEFEPKAGEEGEAMMVLYSF